MIKLDHNRSCPWVYIAQVTEASTIRQTGTISDMRFDLLDMSKIKTIGGNRHCAFFFVPMPRQSCML